MTTYIGVDIGYTGGIAVLSDTRTFGTPIPTFQIEVKTKRGLAKRKRYDLSALRRFFQPYVTKQRNNAKGSDKEWYDAEFDVTQCHVTLEEQFPMPQQGVTSMYSVGLGYGIFQGLLTGLNMKYMTVHPKKWQAEFGIRGDASIDGGTKEQALGICEELFPNVNLMASERATVAHKGIVDALLIALYGKRLMEEYTHQELMPK